MISDRSVAAPAAPGKGWAAQRSLDRGLFSHAVRIWPNDDRSRSSPWSHEGAMPCFTYEKPQCFYKKPKFSVNYVTEEQVALQFGADPNIRPEANPSLKRPRSTNF
ncbi:hypothetical protein PMIN04_007130 [Paraphaeosphaeria minitans]